MRPPEKAADSEDDTGETTVPAEVAEDVTAVEAVEVTEPAQVDAPAEVTDQTVIGKPAALIPEPQEVPSEEAAPETAAPQAAAPEPAAPQPASTAGEDEPAEAPRLVTSTRRRTARRPAGPPVVQTSGVSALSDVAPRSGAGRQSAPSAEPVAVPVEPAAPGHAPEPDPRVDEDASAQGDTWPTDPAADPEPGEGATDVDADEDPGGASSLLHVPIKRKGSRKR
jgi:ribonuclease E